MRYRIGIDLGGTCIKMGLMDEEFHMAEESRIPTPQRRLPEAVVSSIRKEIDRMLTEHCLSYQNLTGIGIGSPGAIDPQNGVVLYSNNFDWKNVPLQSMLQSCFNVSIKMENDAQCAALGEAVAGAGKEFRNFILLTLGTGVGSGIIINGQIFETAHLGGSVAGHMVIRQEGEPCSCGRKGCFEAYCSASALIREMRKAVVLHPETLYGRRWHDRLHELEAKTVFDEAEENREPDMIHIINNYIEGLADGIANLTNLFRPDAVLLGGGVSSQGTKLTEPVADMLKQRCFAGDQLWIPEIRTAVLGNKAGMIGAAALCNHKEE